MITSFRDHITEELIASVKAAEARISLCRSTEVLAGEGPCDSLAEYCCSVHGNICEFHAVLCILGECTTVSRLEVNREHRH